VSQGKKLRKTLPRWREQVARLLADAGLLMHANGVRAAAGQRGLAAMLCEPDAVIRFDVHAARELALSMVSMADEQAVFEDWCESLGWMANPLVFGSECPECQPRPAVERTLPSGAMVVAACSRCAMYPLGPRTGIVPGGWPGKLAQQWPGKPSAAMGRSIARVGQRLLDTLDGRCPWAPNAAPQPSKCGSCLGLGTLPAPPSDSDGLAVDILPDGDDVAAFQDLAQGEDSGSDEDLGVSDDASEWGSHTHSRRALQRCPDCRGTGHNLRGYLPAIEWPACASRPVAELLNEFASSTPFHPDRVREAYEALVPGPHRDPGINAHPRVLLTREPEGRPSLDERITARAALDYAWWTEHPTDRLPSWRRGEIRHARRQLAREQAGNAMMDEAAASLGLPPSIVRGE
jgi:hypothetical protein